MNKLIPLEFKNQRIMTTRTLAEQYGTNEQNISKNFTRNSERFIEGKHYFRLEGEELKQFKGYVLNDESLKFVSVLYLWTEKGAARHAKILDTDEAWEVYEALEETYFRVKDNNIAINQLSPELQMFKQIFDSVAQQQLEQQQIKKEITQTKEEVQAIRDVVEISPKNNWREETNKIVSKICRKFNDYKKPKDEIYAALEQRARCNLKTRLNNLRGRAFDNCWSQSKINALNNLDVIADDIKLIEIYTAIVKEMAIKYKVA
ncbi:ORF6N domain-containing protein [Clostridium sp. Marseille-QA1073]